MLLNSGRLSLSWIGSGRLKSLRGENDSADLVAGFGELADGVGGVGALFGFFGEVSCVGVSEWRAGNKLSSSSPVGIFGSLSGRADLASFLSKASGAHLGLNLYAARTWLLLRLTACALGPLEVVIEVLEIVFERVAVDSVVEALDLRVLAGVLVFWLDDGLDRFQLFVAFLLLRLVAPVDRVVLQVTLLSELLDDRSSRSSSRVLGNNQNRSLCFRSWFGLFERQFGSLGGIRSIISIDESRVALEQV